MKQRSVCIFGRRRSVAKISQQSGHIFWNAIFFGCMQQPGPNMCGERCVWWIDERVSYVFRRNIYLALRLPRRWERVGTGDKIVYV